LLKEFELIDEHLNIRWINLLSASPDTLQERLQLLNIAGIALQWSQH
jgi:hypothetical protein